MSLGEISVYLGWFLFLAAAGFGISLPEEIALPMAGAWAGANTPGVDTITVRWWILLPSCILGVLVADLVLYELGRRYGDHLLEHRWIARLVRPETRQRIEENFHRYGISILIFGRLVPGIRAPLFLTSGAIRLPRSRFLLADCIGAVLGNSLFFFLGFWLGHQFVDLVTRVEKLKPILILSLLVALAIYLVYFFLRHPVSTGDPEDMPLIGHQVAQHMHHSEDGNPPMPSQAAPAPERKVEEHR